MKEIILTKGYKAQVDDSDWAILSQLRWHYHSDYGVRWSSQPNRKLIYMHKVIAQSMGLLGETDHIDRNGLNNQRQNLRECTHAQNMANKDLRTDNTSRYRGVSWHSSAMKWTAFITVNQKTRYLGLFNSPIDAAIAYDVAAKHYFGEFAVLNFPN